MHDYSFGNYLYEKRKQSGDSQNELGKKLGVTGKAVSKWENGSAKPKTEVLRRLAAIWGVSVDELLRFRAEERQQSVTKIVITGGPCAGIHRPVCSRNGDGVDFRRCCALDLFLQ